MKNNSNTPPLRVWLIWSFVVLVTPLFCLSMLPMDYVEVTPGMAFSKFLWLTVPFLAGCLLANELRKRSRCPAKFRFWTSAGAIWIVGTVWPVLLILLLIAINSLF
jgi:hypothetical protein